MKTDYGILDKPIKLPENIYDLYYVRNNPKIFIQLPHPKVWVGSPYIPKCFEQADAIITFTDAWNYKLKNHNKGIVPKIKLCTLYQGQITSPNKVITFHQSYDEKFEYGLKNTEMCQNIQKMFGGQNSSNDFIIGHFGRVSESCYPHSLLHILPKIFDKHPNKNIKIIFCGFKNQQKVKINSKYINIFPGFSRNHMPYAISACDLILSNYRDPTAHYGGSQHILEAMACGIPILTGDFDVRKEQLGDDYELFWNFIPNGNRATPHAEKQMINHISKLINDLDFRKSIIRKLLERAKFYTISENVKRLERDINNLVRQ